MTWPRDSKPTSRQIDMLYRYWDYLPRTMKTFTPPKHVDHAFKALGRGHYIGYSLAILGLDLLDTECEKKYLDLCFQTRNENPDADVEKPGVVFCAGVLQSEHWLSPSVKLENRNVRHVLSQHEHEFENASRHIDGQPHRLHYEVLKRHYMRLLKVYRCIATDHNLTTLATIDKKPTKTQMAIRQGAEQAANEVKQNDDDILMESSSNEPTAQKQAARKE